MGNVCTGSRVCSHFPGRQPPLLLDEEVPVQEEGEKISTGDHGHNHDNNNNEQEAEDNASTPGHKLNVNVAWKAASNQRYHPECGLRAFLSERPLVTPNCDCKQWCRVFKHKVAEADAYIAEHELPSARLLFAGRSYSIGDIVHIPLGEPAAWRAEGDEDGTGHLTCTWARAGILTARIIDEMMDAGSDRRVYRIASTGPDGTQYAFKIVRRRDNLEDFVFMAKEVLRARQLHVVAPDAQAAMVASGVDFVVRVWVAGLRGDDATCLWEQHCMTPQHGHADGEQEDAEAATTATATAAAAAPPPSHYPPPTLAPEMIAGLSIMWTQYAQLMHTLASRSIYVSNLDPEDMVYAAPHWIIIDCGRVMPKPPGASLLRQRNKLFERYVVLLERRRLIHDMVAPLHDVYAEVEGKPPPPPPPDIEKMAPPPLSLPEAHDDGDGGQSNASEEESNTTSTSTESTHTDGSSSSIDGGMDAQCHHGSGRRDCNECSGDPTETMVVP